MWTKYRKSLDDLHGEFCRQSDVMSLHTRCHKRYHKELYLELIDLQCDNILKEKFNSFKLDEFKASSSAAKFPNILKMAQRVLVVFGTKYVCEQSFSVINTNKPPYRSQFSDEHLRLFVLRIATMKLTPDFNVLAK